MIGRSSLLVANTSGGSVGAAFSNPSTLPTWMGMNTKFSPSGNALAVSHFSSPYITVYAWSNSGFGAKYSNPSTLPPNNGRTGLAFSPSGNAVALSHDNSPYVSVYAWSDSTGFGTKYSDPSSPYTSTPLDLTFSPNGNVILAATDVSAEGYMSAYAWSGVTGFGTKYSNPSVLPNGWSGATRSVVFSPSGDRILMSRGSATSNPLSVFVWSDVTGFGSRVDSGNFSSYGDARCAQFSPNMGHVVHCGYTGDSTSTIAAFVWDGSSFSSRTVPTGGPGGVSTWLEFIPGANAVVVNASSSPYFLIFNWSPSGFGSKITPASPAANGAGKLHVHPSGNAIAIANGTSPYIQVFPWIN